MEYVKICRSNDDVLQICLIDLGSLFATGVLGRGNKQERDKLAEM